ncbi:DUF2238 domain-containing protein [Sphingomonas fennica]|nr:DUF2238 domain-containing protein [Sphingomonas fennica]
MTGYRAAWRSLPVAQRWMSGLLALAVLLANVAQPFPEVAPLHHLPTVAVIAAAPLLLARWPLSTRAVAFLFVFWLLHTLGGRYTYSNVPYDAWASALFGVSTGDLLGTTRNHYDRLVHLAFGVTSIPVAMELARRQGAGPFAAACLGVGFVAAASAVYEIFEWGLTLVMAGGAADAYNGQQGDIWDAQKDMAMAMLGALAMAAVELRRRAV